VGQDVEEWERSHPASGIVSPDDKIERWNNERIQGEAKGRQREWEKGEFDEGLIREQVSVVI
jgi:hypothetical protein